MSITFNSAFITVSHYGICLIFKCQAERHGRRRKDQQVVCTNRELLICPADWTFLSSLIRPAAQRNGVFPFLLPLLRWSQTFYCVCLSISKVRVCLPARVWRRGGVVRSPCFMLHKGYKPWPCLQEFNRQCKLLAQMAPQTQRNHKNPQHRRPHPHIMHLRGHTEAVVIQGRGHNQTQPTPALHAPALLPLSFSDTLKHLMLSIIHICITIGEWLLSTCYRNPHHLLVQCAMQRKTLHFTALHQLNEVSKKNVSVPLAEALSVIGHLENKDTHML